MTGFMDLSMEIRVMIYEYCLVKNYTFVPYNQEFYHMSDRLSAVRKDPPALALLEVSRTIEAEAAPVLYGRNVWRITTHAPVLYTPTLSEPKWRTLWENRGELIKHIVLVFDQRDIDAAEYVLFMRFLHDIKLPITQEDKLGLLHQKAYNIMIGRWHLKFKHTDDMPNLRSFEVNVDRLYCYVGCCREDILESLFHKLRCTSSVFSRTLAEPGQPEPSQSKLKLLISGIRGIEENKIARDATLFFTLLEKED